MIFHCTNHQSLGGTARQSDLHHQGFELVQLGPLQDGAKGHDGGIPVAPVGVLDMLLDEGQHVRHHVVLAAGGQQHQTHARCLARVPVVVIVVLVLQRPRSVVQRSSVTSNPLGVDTNWV